jgi:hypothetical protein
MGAARAASRRPAVRAALLVLGLALFVVLAVRAFGSLPETDGLAWGFALLLVIVTTPVTIALNAAEFRLIASTAGSPFGWRDALNTTVVASLANLLPVPGAVAVRTTALMRRGASLRRAGEANVLAAVLWALVGVLVAGVAALVSADGGWVAALVSVAAVVGVPVVALRVARLADVRVAQRLVAIEAATVLVSGLRIFLAVRVLRLAWSFGESVVVSFGQVLAALIGFVPGGLGVRELLAGGMASVIGSDTDVAIAATVVDRAAAQVGMVLVLLVLVVLPGGPGGRLLRDVRRPADAASQED